VTIVRENGDVVCRRCTVADRPFARMRGLLGRRGLGGDEGLLLQPASSIHTWFMRFPIDAVFLDADLTVLATRRDLSPWHTARARKARGSSFPQARGRYAPASGWPCSSKGTAPAAGLTARSLAR
jgi:hypothetical protein